MTSRAEKAAVAFILAASFVLFSLYSAATPLFEASDELWHYPFVQHLATGGGLPVQRPDQTDADAPWRQEGSQPPLYYALAALGSAPFDSSNWRDLRRLNPHADMGVPTRDGNANVVLHSPAEQFPWTRAALAVRAARLVSIVLSTLTVWCAYLVAGELFPAQQGPGRSGPDGASRPPFPGRPAAGWLRLGTLVFTACVPMFAFISGSVNNDNAAVLFSTLGVWWALRLARRHDTSPRAAAIAGVIAGLGALSKSSALGLVALFGLAGLLAALGNRNAPGARLRLPAVARDVLRFTLVLLAVTAVLAGWWFARNQVLYGDLLGWNAFLDSVGRRTPPAGLAQLWTEREGFAWAYWGVFGALNVIFPPWVYAMLNGIVALAAAGLAWGALKRLRTMPPERWLAALIQRRAAVLLGAVWIGLMFVALLRWTSLTPASQGRLMFPCIAVIAAGIAWGLNRIHRAALIAGAAVIAAIAIAAPAWMIAPEYAQPPHLAQPVPETPLNSVFGDRLDLIGCAAPAGPAQPGQEATLELWWRLREPVDRNYSVFVHLVDENDVIVAQRDMYPGQGSIATREAAPGYTWSDRYTLRIPRTALAPAGLHWVVGVYDQATGERLGLAPPGGDRAVLAPLALEAAPPTAPPLLVYDKGITLAGYDVDPRTPAAGAPMTVTLHWETTGKLKDDYTVSLQLLDDQANKIAQDDAMPARGMAPTSSWPARAPITDTHILRVSDTAPAGVYKLLLVLYLPRDFSRLGVYDSNGQYLGSEIVLSKLRTR